MKRLILLLSVIYLLFPVLSCADKDGFTSQLFLVSIYNNSASDCTLLLAKAISGNVHKNNRVPVFIPAGTTSKFIMLATQKRSAIVRLSYNCGVDHRITFVSFFTMTKMVPSTTGTVTSSQNMRAYYNIISGINLHTIDWVLEVT